MCRRPYNSRGSGQMCSRAPLLAATPVDPVAMMLQAQQLMQQTMQQILALQQSSVTTTPGSSQPTARSLVKCPDQPAIDADSTDSDWAMFMDSWSRYKAMSKISDQTEVRNELRSTCSSVVNRVHFDFVGAATLNTCTEQQILDHIKSVAVRGMHKEVHCQKVHNLHQAEGESITRYLVRLWAQASLCEFQTPCPNSTCGSQVSYAEDMISGQMIAGLANVDHQGKVLAEAASLKDLQAKFDKLVNLEAMDQATTHLHNARPTGMQSHSATAAQCSQYCQQKLTPKLSKQRREPKVNNPCKGCGETTHPPGKSMTCKDCPAFTISCRNCGIKGHFEKVCRQPKRTQQPSPTSNAIHSDQSVSSAAHSDPNTSDQSAVPVESASSAAHSNSYPSDRSYLFAFVPAHGSKQAHCK